MGARRPARPRVLRPEPVQAATRGRRSSRYSQFINKVEAGQVEKVTFNKTNGDINGDFRGTVDGADTFTTDGPNDDLPESTLELLQEQGVTLEYTSDQPNIFLDSILPLHAADPGDRRACSCG